MAWAKKDSIGYDGYEYLEIDKCADFERKLWFELVECMWKKHRSIYKNHLKYVRNDIVKPSASVSSATPSVLGRCIT